MSRADAGRIIHISKRRERNKEDLTKQKTKLEEEQNRRTFVSFLLAQTTLFVNLVREGIKKKFTSNVDDTDERLKASTVGLVTLDEMKERQKEILQKADDIVTGKADVELEEEKQRIQAEKPEPMPQVRSLVFLIMRLKKQTKTL